jgi:hypothetical protein
MISDMKNPAIVSPPHSVTALWNPKAALSIGPPKLLRANTPK